MTHLSATSAFLAALPLMLIAASVCHAATEDLGNGFLHHGVATPVSNHRGTVATVDGDGRNVVLVWLFDHRGGYALLMIDAETGKSEQVPMPFPPGGDGPYASLLSTGNKFYTHFNSHFCEFDPAKRAFTFRHKTAKQMAMGMTEDDNGVIWSVTYPNSGVVSFDPKTRAFRDYGHVHKENWRQYQRAVATDDTGWLYFGIGSTRGQLMGLDPETSTAKPMVPESARAQGTGFVYRGVDGKVYGQPVRGKKRDWYVLYKGEATKLDAPPSMKAKPIITSSQDLFHRRFPDGSVLRACDLVDRVLTVQASGTKEVRRVTFDYTSEGAHLMGLCATPDGTICGGTAFPMRFFSFDPKQDAWTNRAAYGQWNTVARQGEHCFVGGYGGGFLLEWNPAAEWVHTVKGRTGCNPLFLTQCTPTIHRPHDLLAHPDGRTLVLAGTPGYGYTGGGLLFWDRETGERTLVEHTDIIPEHSTMSLVALPAGMLLGGTTTSAGTGGEIKATEAAMYIMDLATKKLVWTEVVFPDVQSYSDMCMTPEGLVFGFTDYARFFVFDPATRKVIHEQNTEAVFGRTNTQQGPRTFVKAPDDTIYVLFKKGVAKVAPKTFEITMVAESPVPIGPGGDILDGRIYFGSGSHLYSCGVGE